MCVANRVSGYFRSNRRLKAMSFRLLARRSGVAVHRRRPVRAAPLVEQRQDADSSRGRRLDVPAARDAVTQGGGALARRDVFGRFDERQLETVWASRERSASCRCNAGATRAAMASIPRIILTCVRDAAFIWNVNLEMPPSAWLCRRILSTTSSGLPTSRAPLGPRCASKLARVIGGHPRSLPISVIATA